MAKKYINIMNRSYLFGDFDNDGIPNIDDKYPFDKKKRGMVTEISLAKELRAYRMAALEYKKETLKVNSYFKSKGYKTKYRVKSVNSILNKLRRKRLVTVQDIGGVMVLTKSPKESYKAGQILRNNFKVIDSDDYYQKPLTKFYRALHYVILVNGKYLEIQIKTSKEAAIHLREHTKYKEGKLTAEREIKLKKEVESIPYY